MELNALPLSLCRVPAFSFNDKLNHVWEDLKAKIQIATPAFYEQIAEITAQQIDTLPEKIQFTIWKYFNRAKYRATPFATFASYTLVPLGNEKTTLKINAEMLSHHFIDWKAKETIDIDLKQVLNQAHLLYSNTSAYQTATEMRYLQFTDGTFELASVYTFPELTNIMEYCKIKRNKTDLYAFMQIEHQLEERQCKQLIMQLIALQLLHTDRTANITGEDYFTRLKRSHFANEDFKNQQQCTENYILAKRKLESGNLDSIKGKSIAEAINFLAQLLPNTQNNELTAFKNAFIKKFEHQEISLAMVMDPELGIGYGNLIEYEQADDLIEHLQSTSRRKLSSKSIQYTPLHQFLINGLMQSTVIQLEDFEIAQSKPSNLPNTMSVLCHFYKNNAVISNAGGCTANALLGRFTLGNDELAQHCKEIAEFEEQSNPDVLFFDIPYQAETHIDNINRRKSCYSQELPILTWSCFQQPLDFNDVLVSIKADEVILFSKKLGKRLIPRLASAYNYNRSDLAVYRFLCDLQHQSIQSNLTFDIQQLLPGLKYYPRVNYKSIIVSPAQWLLPSTIYQEKNKSQEEKLTELANWFKLKNINSFVKTGIADQTLCFNPSLRIDLIALLNYGKQQGEKPIYLTEALIDEEDSLTDEVGKKYFSEFIINYQHNTPIYQAVSPKELSIAKKAPVSANFLPGNEWLYFEIFIHPSKSNNLLGNEIDQFLKLCKTSISQWFFIRYDENGKHLRLRLHLKETANIQDILKHFNELLAPVKAKGIVTEVLIKSYQQEIARYGANRIASVEQFFYLDSKYILSLIAKAPSPTYLYKQALLFINQLTEICFPVISDRLAFVKQMSDAFAMEFNMGSIDFKKINQAYLAYKNIEHLIISKNNGKLKQIEDQARIIFNKCTASEKSKMLADLIHMHINRLFNDHQRFYEGVCYQFFYKQLLTSQRREDVKLEHQFSA